MCEISIKDEPSIIFMAPNFEEVEGLIGLSLSVTLVRGLLENCVDLL